MVEMLIEMTIQGIKFHYFERDRNIMNTIGSGKETLIQLEPQTGAVMGRRAFRGHVHNPGEWHLPGRAQGVSLRSLFNDELPAG